MTFFSFLYFHKDDRYQFDKIISKDIVDFFFYFISQDFVAIFIDDDEIHVQINTKFFTKIIFVDDDFVGFEEAYQVLFEAEKKDVFDLVVKIWFDRDGSSLAFLIDIDDLCFMHGVDLLFDRREGPAELWFQRSHRNALSPKKQVFDDVDFGFTSEEFF